MIEKNCIKMFPGVDYKPFKTMQGLNAFVFDIQRLGFTDYRKKRLLEAVAPFCINAAKTYAMTNKLELKEFAGAAWLAITDTLNHFDPTCNIPFLALLQYWLKHYYSRVIYKMNMGGKRYSNDRNPAHVVSLETPIDETGKLTLMDFAGDNTGAEKAQQLEQRRHVENLIKATKLSPRESKVLMDFYGVNELETGTDLQVIADCLSISKERVRQLKYNAILKIKDFIKEQKENENTERKHFERP